MEYWGITGTNGKTTTAWILSEFINTARERRCGYITTVEVDTCARKFTTNYTTPPLKQLEAIYAEMEANGCTDCVMEVSSHAIHQHRTGATPFSGGAFTNLSAEHLDYHKTMEEYFRVKRSFAERIAANKCGAPYVVCTDSEYGKKMLAAIKDLPLTIIPVSIQSPAYDLSALHLIGDYNKSNVLTAAALAEAAGIAHEQIQTQIPKLMPRWGRLERVENAAVLAKVYVDFAHTPDGLEKVLTAARGITRGELWVVFGAGGERDTTKRPLMGEVCSRLADRIVVTSDNPRGEDPNGIIEAILSGVRDKEAIIESDRKKAIFYALSTAQAGDVVIIAGKGHESTQEIGGVKLPFNDRMVVESYTRRGEEIPLS